MRKPMKIKAIKLPDSERFVCSPKQVKNLFLDVEDLSVHFGSLGKTFHFDGRCTKCPKLTGHITASLAVTRQRTSLLSFYALQRDELSETSRLKFTDHLLPQMKNWLGQQLAKPETEIVGVEQLLVELIGSQYKTHELRFL
jgi:hypothetical protein